MSQPSAPVKPPVKPPPQPPKKAASWRGALLRWLAQRWGLGRADPYITALTGLAKDPSVPFPRELIPMLATQSARALWASQVFQVGPDWVWPYWVHRQLDPRDEAYMPRAMSPLWHNLTHRNWTAVGVPDGLYEGVVDPRGLLMPQRGAWSVDIALFVEDAVIAPSRMADGYEQEMAPEMPLVLGRFSAGSLRVTTEVWAERMGSPQMARLRAVLEAGDEAVRGARFAFSLRPYNPEGPAVIHRIEASADGFSVEGKPAVVFADKPVRTTLSTFWEGDALFHDDDDEPRTVAWCNAGLASGAAFYEVSLDPGERMVLECAAFIDPAEATQEGAAQVRASLRAGDGEGGPSREVRRRWQDKRDGAARIELCDAELQRLFEQAHTTLLVLDDMDSIKPGPFTYHQHWFRDSAYLVTALGRLGHRVSARQKLSDYAERQDKDGFFRSQDGEWDSNGQAIWTLVEHFRLFQDKKLLEENWDAIEKGARWVVDKRKAGPRPPGHAGLLPAGISAEHLGPHDYYLWDDFWGVAGLKAASLAASALGKRQPARDLLNEADLFLGEIEVALDYARKRLGRKAMPAAPSRRFDAGMIGNVVSVYPLDLFAPTDERVVDTLAVLEERFFVDDAFLQAMVHSGYNIYLTLQCAQVYLKAGRTDDAWRLLRRSQALATSCGNWPEAVHPRTLGGCMGDGCHGWAAAELCLFVRNALAVEDGDRLVLTPVFPDAWRAGLSARQLPTYFGEISFAIEGNGEELSLLFDPSYLGEGPSEVVWCLPTGIGRAAIDDVRVDVDDGQRRLLLPRGARRAKVWLAG